MEEKVIETKVKTTKPRGAEILVRYTPFYNEVGIVAFHRVPPDTLVGDAVIYWDAKDTEKIVEALREVMGKT